MKSKREQQDMTGDVMKEQVRDENEVLWLLQVIGCSIARVSNQGEFPRGEFLYFSGELGRQNDRLRLHRSRPIAHDTLAGNSRQKLARVIRRWKLANVT